MQLAVDIGNSRIKTALFEGEELISSEITDLDPVYVINETVEKSSKISSVIISSVGESIDEELIQIPESIQLIILDHECPLPISNKYGSPETLGIDRIALAVGANSHFPDTNSLIIDAGTCLTIDMINNKNEYLGGIISPGFQLRLNAMHYGTANLPLLRIDNEIPPKIGKTTHECMKSGAVNGMLNEIIGTIQSFESEFKDLQIIITGGDAKLFENEIKSGFFADPNLVLRGLNKILLYNIEKH